MIMTACQGNNKFALFPFKATYFNGFAPPDMVLPCFMMINGTVAAKTLDYSMREDPFVYYRIVKRSVLLFLIGFFLNWQGATFDIFNTRIMGILQRVGMSYLFVGLLRVLVHRTTHQFMIISFLPAIYAALLVNVEIPGCGTVKDTPACNLEAYVD
jgi:predicted acyltransferase